MEIERSFGSLRPLMSGAAATAGLAMSISAVPAIANAQSATPNTRTGAAASADETVLNRVTVTGQGGKSPNTNERTTGISRIAASIKETPKTINVVPAEVIEQQRATTLEQALRNVPGITFRRARAMAVRTAASSASVVFRRAAISMLMACVTLASILATPSTRKMFRCSKVRLAIILALAIPVALSTRAARRRGWRTLQG